jgi:rare lipoprotein A
MRSVLFIFSRVISTLSLRRPRSGRLTTCYSIAAALALTGVGGAVSSVSLQSQRAAAERVAAAEQAAEVEQAAARKQEVARTRRLAEEKAQRLALQRRRQARLEPVEIIQTRATWYGPGFHGRLTANGERFDQNAMTLASRHLPFDTRVRVVNPQTGKSAIARVNDRGPFGKKDVLVDLSRGVAREIGLEHQGIGPVRLEILPRESE